MYFWVEVNPMKNVNKKELSYCSKKCDSKIENGKLECDCGNDVQIFEWCWKNDSSVNFILDSRNLEITFHPIYSAGTAVVSGDKFLQQNMHFYWEIKIISKLYGTDVMVGVGTEKTKNCKSLFCSVLGIDDQSYGYSYHGIIQHNKLTRKYGKSFGLGCIVGIHLDMYTGKLEYYLNRRPLGIAFDGLKNKQLYPMVCSTAAQSAIRLNCALSQEETLQMLCLKRVQQYPFLYEKYQSIPGLYKYYNQKYFWMVPRDFEIKSKEQEEEDLHLLTMNNSLKYKPKKRMSEYLWSKPSKKVTKHPNESETSSPSVSEIKDSESDEVCKLLYDCLNDTSSENTSDSDTNSDLSFMVPIETNTDPSY